MLFLYLQSLYPKHPPFVRQSAFVKIRSYFCFQIFNDTVCKISNFDGSAFEGSELMMALSGFPFEGEKLGSNLRTIVLRISADT